MRLMGPDPNQILLNGGDEWPVLIGYRLTLFCAMEQPAPQRPVVSIDRRMKIMIAGHDLLTVFLHAAFAIQG